MTPGSALTRWSGWEPQRGSAARGGAPAFVESANDLGVEVGYELLAVAGRGFRPPGFLSTEAAAEQDATDEGGRAAAAGESGFRCAWSLLYRQVAETVPETVEPFAIYLLGVNPPAGATAEELEVFNDFYTNVHLPEVAERRHALRAVRYELVREVKPPYRGAPQFLAVYEVDEVAAAQRRHVGPPYSSGPDVWQRHRTPWRLWYRRLTFVG